MGILLKGLGKEFNLGPIPGRKRPAICLVKGTEWTPLGYFTHPKGVDLFGDWLAALFADGARLEAERDRLAAEVDRLERKIEILTDQIRGYEGTE